MNLDCHLKACLLDLHIELLASSYSNQKCMVDQTLCPNLLLSGIVEILPPWDTLITQKGLEIQWFNESKC